MRTSLALAACLAASILSAQTGNQLLTLRPQEGQQLAFGLTLNLGGADGILVRSDLDWRVMERRADGTVLVEQAAKNARALIDNQEIKFDDASVTQFTLKPTGELVAMRKAGIRPEDFRLQRIVTIGVPSEAVASGHAWKRTYPGDAATGVRASEHNFKWVATEVVSGEPCAAIEVTAKETEGANPMRANGKAWIGARDGLLRRLTLQITDAPMGEGGKPIALSWSQELREW